MDTNSDSVGLIFYLNEFCLKEHKGRKEKC